MVGGMFFRAHGLQRWQPERGHIEAGKKVTCSGTGNDTDSALINVEQFDAHGALPYRCARGLDETLIVMRLELPDNLERVAVID
jgi:hypothetical protein